jgi:hypothetical protein
VVNEGLAPALPGQALPWRCRSCGTSLDPATDAQCPQCGHLVVSLELPDLEPLLAAAEAALDAPRQAPPELPRPALARARSRLGEGAYGPARLDRRADQILEDARGRTREAHWAWELGELALQWLRAILTR